MGNMKPRFVTKREELEEFVDLTPEEKAYFERGGGTLPLRISTEWLENIDSANDPLRLQAVPREAELKIKENEWEDPLGDNRHSPCPGLIHHYSDRALILITDKCAMYCRHCFRRHFTGQGQSLSLSQIDGILSYINEHREIHEILISGGDSLMAPREKLAYLFDGLNALGRPLVKRMGTRLPVAAPGEVKGETLELLAGQNSLWMVLQVNHPKEMGPAFDQTIDEIRRYGIPLLNQAVLLKGINDTVAIQKSLCYGLIERGIKPYYLFQGDMARGTSHFRVPLDRAMELYTRLSAAVSHLALPRFALDLPGGDGKVNWEENALVKCDESHYYFRNAEGVVGRYPREKE